ncbi:OmpA family protein [Mariprofundus sp. NF]|uniref:OmpA family protein n=1 Tax=Mariprofundus sp. NF TaxID=2608716 RepID=UPI0015A35134|nr:OmpA family protein [Mariprofundus sp. NF]NWF37853.1 OmpA family protein [Mariprofundus sp. NF]
MIKRMITLTASLSLAACAGYSNINIGFDELSEAKAAIADAKAAGAERCAPKLQAQAVASLYWAGHELEETGNYDAGEHAEEEAMLVARAVAKAKAAKAASKGKCMPEIIKLSGIQFPHDSARLTPAATAILDNAVKTLQRRSSIKVEVAAHTDSSGSNEYNQALSDRRAASVMNYLGTHGVSASRLTSKGYGESQPIVSNATKEGRTANRRVELRVLN